MTIIGGGSIPGRAKSSFTLAERRAEESGEKERVSEGVSFLSPARDA
jgi:hypothetical protein